MGANPSSAALGAGDAQASGSAGTPAASASNAGRAVSNFFARWFRGVPAAAIVQTPAASQGVPVARIVRRDTGAPVETRIPEPVVPGRVDLRTLGAAPSTAMPGTARASVAAAPVLAAVPARQSDATGVRVEPSQPQPDTFPVRSPEGEVKVEALPSQAPLPMDRRVPWNSAQ